MSFFQEYSLLIAVSIPVAVLVAMNVALWISGEHDTLVMPGFMRFPSMPIPAACQVETEATMAVVGEAANDADDRLAA